MEGKDEPYPEGTTQDNIDNANEYAGFIQEFLDEYKQGYKIFEIDTIDNSNQPISLISDLSTTSSKMNDSNKELSETNEWLKRMEIVNNTYEKGTFILDRGFDGAILMQKIIEMGCDFIVRARDLKRNIYINGIKTTISETARKRKGYYKFTTKIDGKTINLKVSTANIVIKNKDASELKNHHLQLVIIKGFGGTDAYMALITSRNISGKDKVLQVVRDYLLRWKIEENFRFKKQQYGLEKIKVRRYKRIQVLCNLLSKVLLFNNIINLKAVGKTIRRVKNQIRKNVIMWLYRLSDGIKKIMTIMTNEIMLKLYPKRTPRTRNLFTVMKVRFRMA